MFNIQWWNLECFNDSDRRVKITWPDDHLISVWAEGFNTSEHLHAQRVTGLVLERRKRVSVLPIIPIPK